LAITNSLVEAKRTRMRMPGGKSLSISVHGDVPSGFNRISMGFLWKWGFHGMGYDGKIYKLYISVNSGNKSWVNYSDPSHDLTGLMMGIGRAKTRHGLFSE
jgi:hypothetical protein